MTTERVTKGCDDCGKRPRGQSFEASRLFRFELRAGEIAVCYRCWRRRATSL